MSLEETDIMRHREITSKAVSAILILTLKWFKTSRTLSLLRGCSQTDSLGRIYTRRDEVSLLVTASCRLQLFAIDSQDVWTARGSHICADQE